MSMLLRRHYATNNNNTAKGVAKKAAPEPVVTPTPEPTPAPAEELTLTAKDINKMNGAKLRKLAKQNGVADPEELTVGELKAILCEKFS